VGRATHAGHVRHRGVITAIEEPLPKLSNRTSEPLSPDVNLERILPHIDALDEQLDDPRLLGGEHLVPDCCELGRS
jgi:hypothetical protein